ncbi:MAG TPA: metallophosphoesterase [Actinobacteria bacterium]|nr:metallophosphoesterase [Actinomycetota bacterium]
MLLLSDIHGAFGALAAVAKRGETLLILGDFLNFLDYRTLEGMVTDELGIEFAADIAEFRRTGDYTAARHAWGSAFEASELDLREAFLVRARAQYVAAASALEGAKGYATYGNVDLPELLAEHLPPGVAFMDAAVVEIEGLSVGFVGGATVSAFMGGKRVTEDEMAERLALIGDVDVLCTHVPPAVRPLRTDVVTGRQERASVAIADYLSDHRPAFHYFGDVHQPQAIEWRVGDTLCRNVGYFRATGRPVRHE